jgi:hypothetical protein
MNRAMQVFDVKEDEISPFETVDVFNENNILGGFICRHPDHRYGALLITKVNDESCCQLICPTPKMHYPFDKAGNFNWPEIRELQIWEKLDGTNILAYHYDHRGKDHVTFKTRLTPIIRDMKFGYFESMWRELLETRQWIIRIIQENPDFNISFELFGERNPITIHYQNTLDAALLFGVRRLDYAVKPPTELIGHEVANLPRAFPVDSIADMTAVYNQIRAEMTEKNSVEILEEGVMLYAHIGEPSWKQFKCKPEQVEKIHWANGGIPHNALWTTAINTYESNESPTLDDFIQLLREEYGESQIQRSIIRVQKIYSEAQTHMEMVAAVNKAWMIAQGNGFDVTQDKAATMRFLSKYFDKKDMRKVGSIVLKQAGLL